jgi:hypothetical protein
MAHTTNVTSAMLQIIVSKINERHGAIQHASSGLFGVFCVAVSSPHLYGASAFICDLTELTDD